MKIKLTIGSPNKIEPTEEELYSSESFVLGDQLRSGFENGELVQAVLTYSNGYVMTYERTND
jgi:hypothetical protein